MQLVNGAQLLNVNFLFPLLGAATASVFVAVIDKTNTLRFFLGFYSSIF